VLVVEVVLVEVLVEVLLVDVLVEVLVEVVLGVARFRPGGPEWQWFRSPFPQPGWQGTVVDELVGGVWGLPLTPPEIAQADAPVRTTAATTDAASLNTRAVRSTTRSFPPNRRPLNPSNDVNVTQPAKGTGRGGLPHAREGGAIGAPGTPSWGLSSRYTICEGGRRRPRSGLCA
jgi:hypothetical protein